MDNVVASPDVGDSIVVFVVQFPWGLLIREEEDGGTARKCTGVMHRTSTGGLTYAPGQGVRTETG